MPVLLRFSDLKTYGVRNWPTLARWIREEGFPPGFYLAANTRAWCQEHCDRWLANRPKAGPPPDIVGEPAAALPGREAGNGRESNFPSNTPEIAPRLHTCKPFREGGADDHVAGSHLLYLCRCLPTKTRRSAILFDALPDGRCLSAQEKR
jgi:hypothetical protein